MTPRCLTNDTYWAKLYLHLESCATTCFFHDMVHHVLFFCSAPEGGTYIRITVIQSAKVLKYLDYVSETIFDLWLRRGKFQFQDHSDPDYAFWNTLPRWSNFWQILNCIYWIQPGNLMKPVGLVENVKLKKCDQRDIKSSQHRPQIKSSGTSIQHLYIRKICFCLALWATFIACLCWIPTHGWTCLWMTALRCKKGQNSEDLNGEHR